MLKSDERKAIETLKEMISAKYNLLDIVLYGSKACGTDTEESDIDVMVKLGNETTNVRWEIYKMAAEVNINFGCVISLALFYQREIEHGPMKESPLFKQIKKEGIKI